MTYDPISAIETTAVTRVSANQMRGGIAAYCTERGLEPIRCNNGDYLIFSGISGRDACRGDPAQSRNKASDA